MSRLTEPLREEHQELLPHVEKLLLVADSIGETSSESLREGLDEAHAFLANLLIPHARVEEAVLYPIVAKVMGAPEVTATMSQDHLEIGHLTAELEAIRTEVTYLLPPGREKELRRILYGLYTLIKLHFNKEETVYLPLLDDRLSTDETRNLFAAMEQAALEVHPA